MRHPALLALAGLVPLALVPMSARADCALGAGYGVDASSSTVQVCLLTALRSCPDPSGLLRQNVATGEVVRLADYCTTTSGNVGCYVDECVPKGTYRYGLSVPYDCRERGCGGVEYFGVATVEADPPAGCARGAGNGPPTAWSSGVPWPAQSDGWRSCPSFGCSTVGSEIAALDGLLIVLSAAWLWRRRRACR
jgi:hypothetical protein